MIDSPEFKAKIAEAAALIRSLPAAAGETGPIETRQRHLDPKADPESAAKLRAILRSARLILRGERADVIAFPEKGALPAQETPAIITGNPHRVFDAVQPAQE